MTNIFLGEPPASVKAWIIDRYASTHFTVRTTSDHKKAGVYSAQRDDASKSVVINWGDGTVEQVDGDVSEKVHEYATEGEFKATVSNVKTFAASTNNDTWFWTTSQNKYTLKEVVIGSSIISIGDFAFFGCQALTSVTIPDSVTSIGRYAFWYCRSLTSVTIPDSVTSIGDYVFQHCFGLTSVTIGNSVLAIGSHIFSGCSGLTGVTIGNSMTSIGNYAFEYCSGLTSVTIPDSVTSIGNSAFSSCSGLTSVTIGAGVTSIGNYAFSYCSGLISFSVDAGNANYSSVNGLLLSKDGTTLIHGVNGDVTIPDSVTSIEEEAFRGRSGLTSVTIPDGVTSIGGNAFANCSGLTSVHITDIAKWCSISFANNAANPLYLAHNLYLNGAKVTDLTIPDGMTSIGSYVFYGCSGLTSVTIPDSVKSIMRSAFEGCTSLSDVTIGNSVLSVGSCAFQSCTGISSMTIPDNVTNIGIDAFYECTSITDVYCWPNPANLEWNEKACDDFKAGGSTVCHVKAQYLAAYQSKFTGVVNVTFIGDLA